MESRTSLKAKAKDSTLKAKTKDFKIVLEDSSNESNNLQSLVATTWSIVGVN